MSVVGRLAQTIDELHPGRRVLIALDGPDAAGKTTLARQIRSRLRRPAVTASIDQWHNPREVRLRRGSESPEGYYHDSFDYAALTERLLEPFRSGANRVTVGQFDYRSDRAVDRTETVQQTAALLVDGIFLLRTQLLRFWDLTVYLHVPEPVTLARAAARDAEAVRAGEDLMRRYTRRYLPGQALYRADASPREIADIVIDNSAGARVVRWRAGDGIRPLPTRCQWHQQAP